MCSSILPVIQIAPSMTSGRKMRSRNLHHPVSFSALSFSAAVYVADTSRAGGRPFSCSHRTVASFASVRTSPPHGSSIRFECVPVSSSTLSFIVRYPRAMARANSSCRLRSNSASPAWSINASSTASVLLKTYRPLTPGFADLIPRSTVPSASTI